LPQKFELDTSRTYYRALPLELTCLVTDTSRLFDGANLTTDACDTVELVHTYGPDLCLQNEISKEIALKLSKAGRQHPSLKWTVVFPN